MDQPTFAEGFEDTALYNRNGELTAKAADADGFPPSLPLNELRMGSYGMETPSGLGVLPVNITGFGRCYLASPEHDSKDYRYLRLCAAELRSRLCESSAKQLEGYIRGLLTGSMEPNEISEGKKRFGLADGERRFCAVVYTLDKSEAAVSKAENAIRDLAAEALGNESIISLVSMGSGVTAIIMRCGEIEDEELGQLFKAISESLSEEYGVHAIIGIGVPCADTAKLRESYRQAFIAADTGRRYRRSYEGAVYTYNELLLERLADALPEELKRSCAEDYGLSLRFPDDLYETVEVFFENSLNLSEAARSLYIHRNTLVYRLDKLQKLTGFDVRQFNDAATLKMLLLMGCKD